MLFTLLLPAVRNVRDAAAAQAALELRTKSYVAAALCTPPFCNSLDGNHRDVSLKYPPIPVELQPATVLASGLRVAYDGTYLDAQPFGVEPWDANNVHDPGIVALDIEVHALIEADYAIAAVAWLDGEVDCLVRQPEGGQARKLRALIAPERLAVRIVEDAAAIPEPSSLLLVAAATLGLALAHRRKPSALPFGALQWAAAENLRRKEQRLRRIA
ncbi:MAG: hypothetical protein ABT20_05895 [Rubrivivax sp. SCN 70-15]|nr:MAG: hypothetical protein ABT20_05895 [Rubrivivax sp. SCN 70-15]